MWMRIVTYSGISWKQDAAEGAGGLLLRCQHQAELSSTQPGAALAALLWSGVILWLYIDRIFTWKFLIFFC